MSDTLYSFNDIAFSSFIKKVLYVVSALIQPSDNCSVICFEHLIPLPSIKCAYYI